MIETIQIDGPSGRISAELLLPEAFDKAHGRCGLVMLMHGFLGSKRGAPLLFLSRILLAQGYAVLRFDFDGYGESDGAEQDNTPPVALILLAPALILKEYARRGRFFSIRCNPADPPATINLYGFQMGREYILSAQTLPIEEESAWFTGPVCLIHGTWDGIVPHSCSKRYDELYARSELHLLRRTGHLFLFCRHLVRRLILTFLDVRAKQL